MNVAVAEATTALAAPPAVKPARQAACNVVAVHAPVGYTAIANVSGPAVVNS